LNYAGLARRLDLPVMVVSGNKLGVINHTLLTLNLLHGAELPVLACVLNHPYGEASLAVETNADTLRRLIRERLFVIPRLEQSAHTFDELFNELADHCLAPKGGSD